MIHSMDMDVFMADDTTMMQTATAQAQSDIKMGDSVSAITMTPVPQPNKDETTLLDALKQIQTSKKDAIDVAYMLFDVCNLFNKEFASA